MTTSKKPLTRKQFYMHYPIFSEQVYDYYLAAYRSGQENEFRQHASNAVVLSEDINKLSKEFWALIQKMRELKGKKNG